MESTKIAIIIPAYNEAETISNVISELNNELAVHNFTVFVVNDCSQDSTSLIASKAGATVIDLETNHGYSRAIEQGLNYVSSLDMDFHYALTMDADGQHHPSSVKKIIEMLENDKPVLIVGERYQCARFGEWLYGKVYNYLLGVRDPLCGLKAYSISAYREIGVFETFDSIGSELMTKLIQKGETYKVIPVIIRKRTDNARFGNGLKVEIRLLKSLFSSISYYLRSK